MTTASIFKFDQEHEGEDAVEVTNTMGAAALLRKYLESDAGSDLLSEMVKMAAELLTTAEEWLRHPAEPPETHL